MNRDYVIGIDIGGTSIKWGTVSSKGEVLERSSLKFDRTIPQEKMVESLCNSLKEFIKNSNCKIEAIGIACPGAIDTINGYCNDAFNLGFHKLPIVEQIKEATGLETKIANDADCAALGEAIFGSGKDYNSSVMITLGTGIGGGVVLDRKLFLGNGGMGMELGHMVIELSNPRKCTCGNFGCFETYASATALINDTKKAIEENPNSKLAVFAKNSGEVTGKLTFDAMKDGCPVAKKVIDQYINYLCVGLLNICLAYRPNVILLSGGIANSGDYLFTEVNRILEEKHWGFVGYPAVPVIKATVGYDSGIIGAASLVLEK